MKRIILLFVALLVALVPLAQHGAGQRGLVDVQGISYLPIVSSARTYPVGVENELKVDVLDNWLLAGMPVKISANWAKIEGSPGVYDWSSVDRKIGDYQPYWVTVKMTPGWALPVGETRQCALPDPFAYSFLIELINELIARYHPVAVELWNEPDNGDGYPNYGCVDSGADYARFVNDIAPSIQGAKVYAGALAWVGKPWAQDFLDNLRADVGVSYHCYAAFREELEDNCAWTKEKIESLTSRETFLSETAVRYYSGSEFGYEMAQVEFLYWLVENYALVFWYTLANNGWPVIMPTDLVCRDVPRPVYWVLANGL